MGIPEEHCIFSKKFMEKNIDENSNEKEQNNDVHQNATENKKLKQFGIKLFENEHLFTPNTENLTDDQESFYKTRVENEKQRTVDTVPQCDVQNNNVDNLIDCSIKRNDFNRFALNLSIPRGIINPNYPGFQHFAHTLSEHFVDVTSDSFDEMSDNDFDLSASSMEHVNEDFSNSCEYLKKSVKPNVNSTSLEFLDSFESTLKIEIQNSNLQVEKQMTSKYPDIIAKNFNQNSDSAFDLKDRPDILGHITSFNERPIIPKTICANIMCTHIENPKDIFNLTPVDIIGDFGQEVEHECGLIVHGYKNLANEESKSYPPIEIDIEYKIVDAELSGSSDQIYNEISKTVLIKEKRQEKAISCCPTSSHTAGNKNFASLLLNSNNLANTVKEDKLQYRKTSFDERQLPPVGFDYKRCSSNVCTKNKEKSYGKKQPKLYPHYFKPQFDRKIYTKSESNNTSFSNCLKKPDKNNHESHLKMEIDQYQELINQKEHILKRSKYCKLSPWAKYLENSSSKSIDFIPSNGLELFGAYKIEEEVDLDTLQTHFRLAKEIEKKRRSAREQIHRRLAMGNDENFNRNVSNTFSQNYMHSSPNKGIFCFHGKDILSDTESCSSDSETCPKLSKSTSQNLEESYDENHFNHIYLKKWENIKMAVTKKTSKLAEKIDLVANDDCNFFTKQAKLQIEARIALAQAKEMAHMQMEMNKRCHQSRVTTIIRDSLKEAGVYMENEKRRVSRQMLTVLSISKLQIIVNSLNTHIEALNKNLVEILMTRDDLSTRQNVTLIDVEQLTKLICEKEIRSKLQYN